MGISRARKQTVMIAFSDLVLYNNADHLSHLLSQNPEYRTYKWSKFQEAKNQYNALVSLEAQGLLLDWLSNVVRADQFRWLIMSDDVTLAHYANVYGIATVELPRLALVVALTMLQYDRPADEAIVKQFRQINVPLGALLENVDWKI